MIWGPLALAHLTLGQQQGAGGGAGNWENKVLVPAWVSHLDGKGPWSDILLAHLALGSEGHT